MMIPVWDWCDFILHTDDGNTTESTAMNPDISTAIDEALTIAEECGLSAVRIDVIMEDTDGN